MTLLSLSFGHRPEDPEPFGSLWFLILFRSFLFSNKSGDPLQLQDEVIISTGAPADELHFLLSGLVVRVRWKKLSIVGHSSFLESGLREVHLFAIMNFS